MTTTMLKLLIIVYVVIVSPSATTNAETPLDIFILAGQSNMAGRGGVLHGRWDGFVPPESQPRPGILRLNARNTWVPAHEPLHEDIDVSKTCGVGPGMAFANGVISLDGPKVGPIGLVPCAVGGTKISEWARGTGLYDQMIGRAKAAVQGGGSIRGLLWYQGESDTKNMDDAGSYGGKMDDLINDLRDDLGLPSLLVIQVALASGEGKYVEIVREAQLRTKLANVKCVDAKGLRLEPDNLHLTTASQVRLGLMLARTFLNMSHTS